MTVGKTVFGNNDLDTMLKTKMPAIRKMIGFILFEFSVIEIAY